MLRSIAVVALSSSLSLVSDAQGQGNAGNGREPLALLTSPPPLPGGGLVPREAMILGKHETAPAGFSWTGLTVRTERTSWSPRQPLPLGRSMGGAAEIDGKVYYVGGMNCCHLQNTLYRYDPSSNPPLGTWTQLAPMPTARVNLAVVASGGLLYAIGGGTPEDTGAVERYDPVTDTWTSLAAISPRTRLVAAAVNGRVYAIGGSPGGSLTNEVQEYDPSTNTWSSQPPMPTPRADMASAVVDGQIYVMGGTFFFDPLTTLEVYDPLRHSWSTKAPMPTGRTQLAACAANGRIYAIGGRLGATSYAPTQAVESFDPATDAWSFEPLTLGTRVNSRAVALDGVVYTIGTEHGRDALGTVESFDPGRTLFVHRRD